MYPNSILLPVTPNRPLESLDQEEYFGEVLLRTHHANQLTENILYDPQWVIYNKSYQNNQSLSTGFLKHLTAVSQVAERHSTYHSNIVEVGCGKGDFISLLEEKGYTSLIGFDATYQGNKANIHARYLNNNDQIEASLIISRHMLDYVALPHEYLKFLQSINKNKEAKIYIEVPCFNWIKNNNAFFDITYERINYFTLHTLASFFNGNIIESGSLFNGQYIYIVAELSELSAQFSIDYLKSDHWVIKSLEQLFPQLLTSIIKCKEKLTSSLNRSRRAFIWGASTKGCLFLYHYQRSTGSVDSFPFLIDINPEKIGKFAPGTKVPIFSPSEFFNRAKNTDLLIIPNVNYLEEIREQLKSTVLAEIEMLTF